MNPFDLIAVVIVLGIVASLWWLSFPRIVVRSFALGIIMAYTTRYLF